jgi:integrase
MVQRVQRGHVFGVKNTSGKILSWHVRYRVVEMRDGKPVRVLKSHKLCNRSEKYFSAACKAVQDACDQFMHALNPTTAQDMPLHEFWEKTYLPFIKENKKASTVDGYVQIWNQHLSGHFAPYTLQDYRTHLGSQFLLGLTKKQGLRTLNHIRSLASGMFTHAINLGMLEQNPWHDVKILGKVKPAKPTAWYTLEEAENIISALVDHVECQLIMSLACFLGLRPAEIAGLRWEDFDEKQVHIRRAVVRGVVGTCKTPESVASLPLLDQVIVPFTLWHRKCGSPREGWVFCNERGNPQDMKDVVRRTIRPIVLAKKLVWKGLYAGRRGAGTAIIGLTNGNYAAAQELLRHKHMSTTLQFYKKQTTQALSDGVKALEGALNLRSTEPKSMTTGPES